MSKVIGNVGSMGVGLLVSITTLIVMLLPHNAFAQQSHSDCDDAILIAEKKYQEGDFLSCIQTLNNCLASIEKSKQFEAYRLLALGYHMQDDSINTHNAVVNLLRSAPNYRTFPYFDPLSFTKLLAQYTVYPRWELGLQFGINCVSAHPTKHYSLVESPAEFLPKTGYQLLLVSEYHFKPRLSLRPSIGMAEIGYIREAENVSGWKQEYSEKIRFLSLPVAMRYELLPKIANWSMSVELGLQGNALMNTRSVIFLSEIDGESGSLQRSTNQKDSRNKLLINGIAGISFQRSLLGGSFGFDFQVGRGFSNLIKADNRWDNLNFIMKNQYVDSDIRLNSVAFNVSYKHPLPRSYAVIRR